MVLGFLQVDLVFQLYISDVFVAIGVKGAAELGGSW
jgi:hypothetical protein